MTHASCEDLRELLQSESNPVFRAHIKKKLEECTATHGPGDVPTLKSQAVSAKQRVDAYLDTLAFAIIAAYTIRRAL